MLLDTEKRNIVDLDKIQFIPSNMVYLRPVAGSLDIEAVSLLNDIDKQVL